MECKRRNTVEQSPSITYILLILDLKRQVRFKSVLKRTNITLWFTIYPINGCPSEIVINNYTYYSKKEFNRIICINITLQLCTDRAAYFSCLTGVYYFNHTLNYYFKYDNSSTRIPVTFTMKIIFLDCGRNYCSYMTFFRINPQ